ncbi:MAG: cytochrome c [Alphaproteobacteria bacterium]|nr:cytochrome c [Alphaproteobacteria bacterium]
MRKQHFIKAAGLMGFLALTSTVAFGLPWDIDMADAQTVKAYEREMTPLPEGVVAQANELSPNAYRQNWVLGTPEGNALTNPVEKNEQSLATGKKMFQVYCAPCHGTGTELGPVSKQYPGIAMLGGANGRLKAIPDGRLYLTIRNGFGLMPSYAYAMNDTEMWSLVHYARTLPQASYTPPAPVEPQ